MTRSIIYSSTNAHEDRFALLRGCRVNRPRFARMQPLGGGGPLNQRSSIQMLMRLSSRPSFDATTKKLCVVNVVSQHNVTANQQLSSDCNQGFGLTSPANKSQVESLQLVIISGGCLSSFAEKESDQSRTGFADSDVALLLSRRSFHRFHTNISHYLALIAEAGNRLQGMNQAECGQQPETRM